MSCKRRHAHVPALGFVLVLVALLGVPPIAAEPVPTEARLDGVDGAFRYVKGPGDIDDPLAIGKAFLNVHNLLGR